MHVIMRFEMCTPETTTLDIKNIKEWMDGNSLFNRSLQLGYCSSVDTPCIKILDQLKEVGTAFPLFTFLPSYLCMYQDVNCTRSGEQKVRNPNWAQMSRGSE